MTYDSRRAISIRQPWAWLIIRPDLTGEARKAWLSSPERKNIENRVWQTPYRGRLWIHTPIKPDRDAMEALPHMKLSHVPTMDELLLGGIVGHVDLVAIHSKHDSRWFVGPFGWQIDNPTATQFEPLTGTPGIFRIGDRPQYKHANH